jgi:hypothetical protein
VTDIPNEFPEDFPNLSATNEQELTRKRLESNAKSVAKSKRIRWSMRYTILICGAILAACFYFEPPNPWMTGLVCPSFLLILVAAVILFSMGGFAPGSTRYLLTKQQKQRLDD